MYTPKGWKMHDFGWNKSPPNGAPYVTQPISILNGWPSFLWCPKSCKIWVILGLSIMIPKTLNPLIGTLGSQLWCFFFCHLKRFKDFDRLRHVFNTLRLDDEGGSGFCWPKKQTKTAFFHEFTKWMTSWLCRIHSSKRDQTSRIIAVLWLEYTSSKGQCFIKSC